MMNNCIFSTFGPCKTCIKYNHTGPEAMLLGNKSTPKTNNAVK